MRLLRRKRSGPLTVAIFGSGPAGLFATQAVYDAGGIAQIFARGDRSPLYGAQYLHQPIPGLSAENGKATVSYILKGNAADYRRKVYGDGAILRVSPETLAPQHDAWNIRAAYAVAWERYKGLIHKVEIDKQWLRVASAFLTNFDLIVWSIPIASFCEGPHGFQTREVWAQGDAPELNQYCSVNVDPWTIVANGEDSPRWYRASNVFGHRTVEWPQGIKPPVAGVVRVNKPVSTNCDCWGKSDFGVPVIRVGRYGTWTKAAFSHMAYTETLATLEKLGR